MGAHIGDEERFSRGDHILAEGVRERGLPCGGPGQAATAHEDLLVRVHQGDQGYWDVQERRSQAGQAVEGLRRGILLAP
jgi:hypothetical protein